MKSAELLRAKREGRLVEFLYPELEKRGYNRDILTKLGVDMNPKEPTSNEGKVTKSVKKLGGKEDIKTEKKAVIKVEKKADSKMISDFKGDDNGVALNKDKLTQFSQDVQRTEQKPQPRRRNYGLAAKRVEVKLGAK